MARKIKTEQQKKKSKRVLIIVLIVLVLLIIGGILVGTFVFGKDDNKTIVEIKELDNLSDYNYKLTDKDSEYFKKEFEELKKIVNESEVNEEKYATQVAKMFVIDLYTLSTKVNKYDIGGIEYYHSTKKEMFEQKAMDTLYSTLLDDTYGDREQVLPEIKGVEIVSVEKTKYLMGEQVVDGYLVKLNMSYVSDMGYDTKASVVVCKEEGVRWGVVDFQPTFTPKYAKKD
jgi:ABC-type Na+ efflux pump permease subunit